jgi:hypothetical protein
LGNEHHRAIRLSGPSHAEPVPRRYLAAVAWDRRTLRVIRSCDSVLAASVTSGHSPDTLDLRRPSALQVKSGPTATRQRRFFDSK